MFSFCRFHCLVFSFCFDLSYALRALTEMPSASLYIMVSLHVLINKYPAVVKQRRAAVIQTLRLEKLVKWCKHGCYLLTAPERPKKGKKVPSNQ